MDSFTLKRIEFDAVRRTLADYCACSLGKSLALRISASRSPEVIRHWLAQTTQMVAAVRDVGLPPFGGITDITGQLERAAPGGPVCEEDFSRISDALTGAGNVRGYLHALPETLDTLHPLADDIGDFTAEIEAIDAIIAPDATVRDDASPRLGEIRRLIESTGREIHDVIYGYLRQQEVAKLLQNPIVTLHGDRYVLPVKAINRGRLPGVVHRESNTGATVFVEPNASVELNNRLSDYREDERREVRRLLNQLAIRIHGRHEQIIAAMRSLAQVDLLSAKAQYSCQFNMSCPDVAERGWLSFSQARHPLLIEQAWRQEKSGVAEDKRHTVVPIDIRLGSDFDMLVVTGSNTGGKTVTLKTTALLVVMAQSGMHIPVQRGATMPVFRDVFIDIGDEQSLQQSLSTFGGHMKRLRFILSKAGKNSLVLLDELGAGTDPDEGGAIGQAVMDELLRIGCLTMVTTHLSVLKAYAFAQERVDNASVEFDTKTLSPTYHLRIGTPGESHAITVAKRLGLPRRVTSAARGHLSQQGKQFRRAIRATGQARQAAELQQKQAVTEQLEAQSIQESYQSKLADLHSLREQFETWLVNLPNLKPGDELFVPKLNTTGKLVRLELDRQRVVVQAGSVEVEVPLRELIPDLGQAGVREQIDSLRKQIIDQAAAAETARGEADHAQAEFKRSLAQQKQRARQFDQWLGAIARLKVGDVVPISQHPGQGKVVAVNLAGLRATLEIQGGKDKAVETQGGKRKTVELSLQELFPQTGPFARHPAKRQGRQSHPHKGPHAKDKAKAPEPDRPMRRRPDDSKAAKRDRQAVLDIKPGDKVFVLPFNKHATLIRIQPERNLVVVQSGVFEMELPLSDIEPVSKR